MSNSITHKKSHWCGSWKGSCITCSSCEQILGITIDSDLKFDKHISDLCDKVSKIYMHYAELQVIWL